MDRMNSYAICKRCVLDTSFPGITFDESGVCSYCRWYDTEAKSVLLPEEAARQKLESIIRELKSAGRGKDYDCLLGISGGIDSSYIALKLKEFGLRVLGVQFDNGWNSELAVRNIELLCTKLDMDLYTYVVDWEEFRDLQLAFLKASVANAEAPTDHGIAATLYQTADKQHIKYIVNGVNFVTEGLSGPSEFGYAFRDLRQLRAIHQRFGTRPLKTFPQMGFLKNLYYQKIRGIQSIALLNYMPYNKREAIAELEGKIGWRYYGGKHFESVFTRFHQSYTLIRKLGYDKRKLHLANLICSGQLTRQEALEELGKPSVAPAAIEEDIEYVIKKLGITDTEFEQIMAAPIKSHREYPNDERLYDAYASLARLRRRVRTALTVNH